MAREIGTDGSSSSRAVELLGTVRAGPNGVLWRGIMAGIMAGKGGQQIGVTFVFCCDCPVCCAKTNSNIAPQHHPSSV